MEDGTMKAVIIGACAIIVSVVFAMSVKYFVDGFRYEVVSIGERRGYLVDRREGIAIPTIPTQYHSYIVSFPPKGQTIEWSTRSTPNGAAPVTAPAAAPPTGRDFDAWDKELEDMNKAKPGPSNGPTPKK